MLEFEATGEFTSANNESGEAGSGIALDASAVRAQLERLLGSPHFRTSKRCQGLLRHVVDAYLENHLDRVKERTIGYEVFGREPDYDTNHDSVVRTTAAEVRKKLAQYYLEPGHEHEIRLLLPQGSYLPEFRAPEPPAASAQPAGVRKPWRARWAGVALAVLAPVALGSYWMLRPHGSAMELFWKPLMDDRSDAVICVGQPLRIFMFDGARTDELNGKMVGTLASAPAGPDVRHKTSLNLADLKGAGDRYYSVGDYMASVRLAEFLGRRGKPFQVIGDRSTAFKDLRGRPAVLIGQFNNLWTMGLTGNLRYYIDRDPGTYRYDVLDRRNPGKVLFSVTRNAGRPEEYAIVSRIFDAPTERTVIAIAGMTYNGTIAAGEFLTSERYMSEAFQNAPPKWFQRNIQVVLKTAMVAGATGPPKAVAAYYW